MPSKKIPKGFHKTKDGRVVKKGLYFNMNQRKKNKTSRNKIYKGICWRFKTDYTKHGIYN